MKQLVDIKLVKSNPNNPRTIKDDNFKKLVNSVISFPKMLEKRPIVVDENMIVLGGNMRLRACKEAKLKEVWIDTTEDWTEEEKREFIIKDNISGGEWDWDMIANQYDLIELDAWGLDLPDKSILEPEIEEDEAPEVSSEPPVSQLGSIYQLGKHRVMCGDSTDFGQASDLMDGKRAKMCFTDPPYNVDYGSNQSPIWGKSRTIMNDKMTDEEWVIFIDAFNSVILELVDGGIYIAMSCKELDRVKASFEKNGGHWSSYIIWVKQQLVPGRKDYQSKYEPILYGWKEGVKDRYFTESRKEVDVWEHDRPNVSKEHPTMKPISLMAEAINNSSKSGDIVLDLFLGSGSTLIACEQTDRICYGMELDPKYVDVIRKRYAKYCYPDTWEERWEELTPEISVGAA